METTLLAVEIHQSSPTSSDISFDLELIGIELSILKWGILFEFIRKYEEQEKLRGFSNTYFYINWQ